jgi:DNA-binding MarR family transcriptional regulator
VPRVAEGRAPAGERYQPADSVDVVISEWGRVWPELRTAPVGVISRLARSRAFIDAELEAVFAEYGLTNPNFEVLAILRRREPPFELTQRALTEHLRLTSGTVSVRVDRLVDLDLVTRRPDPADGRGAIVCLTDEGVRLCEAAFPRHLANEARLLSALTDSEHGKLAALLRKLLLSYEGEAPADGVPVRLGLEVAPAHVARRMRRAVGLPDRTGLLVVGVADGSPASAAGLAEGDLLVSAGGVELRSVASLYQALTGHRRHVVLAVVRGVDQRTVRLTVPRSDRPRR